MASLQEVAEILRSDGEDQLEVQLETVTVLESIRNVLERIEIQFHIFFANQVANQELNQMKLLEMEREQGSLAGPAPAGAPTETETPSGNMLLGVVAAISGLAAGFVSGIQDSLMAFTKSFRARITKFIEPISEAFDNIGKRFAKIVKGFKDSKFLKVLDDLVVDAYVFLDDIKISVVKKFKALSDGIKGFFDFGPDIAKIKDGFAKLGFGGSGGISKMFEPITELFKRIKSFMSVFVDIGKGVGRILGKLVIPLNVIMSIFDTVTGAIDGFKSEEGDIVDKVIGGVFGGIKGLVSGLLLVPLDLLKSGISWIGEKLGFENFSEALDSFSFADLFREGVDIIKNMFLGFIDTFRNVEGGFDVASIAKGLMANIVNAITLPIRSMLKGIAAGVDKIPFAGEAAEKIRGFADSLEMNVAPAASEGSTGTSSPAALASAVEAASEPVPKPAPNLATNPEPKKVSLSEGVTASTLQSGVFVAYNKEARVRAEFTSVEEASKFASASLEEAATMNESAKKIYEERQQLNTTLDQNFQDMIAETEGPSAQVAGTSSPRVSQTEQLTKESGKLSEIKAAATAAPSFSAPSNNNVSNNTSINNTFANSALSTTDNSDRSALSRGAVYSQR